ncbi:MAG: lytic transglycosylase domain-containing protein [Ardenticatenia bacterium]|nr:lytic transglycosylase domain-containing protein [Ardenticatenia bacterium]
MRQPHPASRLAYPLLLALILLSATLDRPRALAREVSRPPSGSPAVANDLPVSARGLLLRPVGVAPSPWAAESARLAAGTELAVNGQTRLRVGLRQVTVYRVATAGPAIVQGWVAADAVLLRSGTVPLIDPRDDADGRAERRGAGVAPSASAPAPPTVAVMRIARDDLPAWLPESVRRWEAPIADAARRHGIAPSLLAIVVLVESGGWSQAISPAGAYGLTQLMPATAAEMAAATGRNEAASGWRDPVINIDLGAAYLAAQSRAFAVDAKGDEREQVRLIAAAYNGGPGRLRRSLDSWNAPLPTETQRYQRWVVGMWDERRSDQSQHFEEWRAAGGERLLVAASAAD